MEVLRYAAFSADPAGGNPAGVVLDATGARRRDDARDGGRGRLLGDRVPGGRSGAGRFAVRYFSPLAEVPFCGHATIASAVAYADRHGAGRDAASTPAAGEVAVETSTDPAGLDHGDADQRRRRASRRSTRPTSDGCWPRCAGAATSSTRRCRRGWRTPAPGTRSLAVRDRSRLADLDYDFDARSAP